MTNSPSTIEREALGSLLKVLIRKSMNHNKKWEDFITSYFADWNPIMDSDISGYRYYSTLKSFPLNAKREIIRGVLLGWNEHHDHLTLYQCITALIYLKLCGPVEYFFLQQFYSFMSYYESTCPSSDNIWIQANSNSNYRIKFLEKENEPFGHNYGYIDFQMSRINEENRLAIVPTFSLLNIKENLSEDTEHDKQSMDSIVSKQIAPLLNNEFAKKHCPWIYSSWKASYRKDQFGIGVVIIMNSLEYEDKSGVQ